MKDQRRYPHSRQDLGDVDIETHPVVLGNRAGAHAQPRHAREGAHLLVARVGIVPTDDLLDEAGLAPEAVELVVELLLLAARAKKWKVGRP